MFTKYKRTSHRPSVCNVKPVTKQFPGFPLNSVQMFFPNSHRLCASFVKINTRWRHTFGRARISTRKFHISWPIWVKFGTWDLHTQCVLCAVTIGTVRTAHTMRAVCRNNRYSENCALLRGVKNLCPYFAHFLSDLATVPYRQYPQNIIHWQQVS